MAPSKQLAIVVNAEGGVDLKEVDVPKPGPGEVLIKVVAAAQNPTDWKTAKWGKKAGSISGCDFSGIVEEIGPDVAPGLRSVGERVASMVHGGWYQNGSFSEYLVASAERVIRVPESWSLEDAAQLGVAPLTACQCLWDSLPGLPTPLSPSTSSTPEAILVWGGASSVGNYVIQFAKLSGLKVITTASPKNFDLLKSFGADEVYDYRDPEVSKKIRESTGNKLTKAVDCVSEKGTVGFISEALSESEGGTIAVILGNESPRENVKVVPSLAYDLSGKEYDFPRKWTPTPEDIKHGLEIWKLVNDIFASTKIKPSPKLVLPKGLASVPDGFQYMMDGKVSGQKITYVIADTPKA